MAEKRDYYEVLGVYKDADDAAIKKAYRQLANKYHPDMNPGDKEAEAKFKEASEAYALLNDPDTRRQYDQFGPAAFDGVAGGAGGAGGFGGFDFGDMGDIFGDIFGGGFGGFGGSGSRRRGPVRGADIRQRVRVTFEEAAKGVKKEIKVTRNEECSECNGTGAKPGTSKKTCPNCNGTGTVRSVQRTPFGNIASTKTCPNCNGTGEIIETPCSKCKGTGSVRKTKTIEVDIPAGIDDGQMIKLSGQCEFGEPGAPKGDLYIIVEVTPHEIFRRDGYDIYIDMPITFVQAALGDEIEVPDRKSVV